MKDDDLIDEDWGEGDDDETGVVECPNCRADVYEEADSCPACGEFLTGSSQPLDRKPLWFVALGLFGVLAVILLFSGILQWL